MPLKYTHVKRVYQNIDFSSILKLYLYGIGINLKM